MNIDEIKQMKAETERAIRDLVVKFSTASGLVTEGVRFEMTDISTIGGERIFKCTSVEMDVRLG